MAAISRRTCGRSMRLTIRRRVSSSRESRCPLFGKFQLARNTEGGRSSSWSFSSSAARLLSRFSSPRNFVRVPASTASLPPYLPPHSATGYVRARGIELFTFAWWIIEREKSREKSSTAHRPSGCKFVSIMRLVGRCARCTHFVNDAANCAVSTVRGLLMAGTSNYRIQRY